MHNFGSSSNLENSNQLMTSETEPMGGGGEGEFRSPHLWNDVNGEWKLRHNVNKTGTDD